jgi:hypothetical protein
MAGITGEFAKCCTSCPNDKKPVPTVPTVGRQASPRAKDTARTVNVFCMNMHAISEASTSHATLMRHNTRAPNEASTCSQEEVLLFT